MKRKTNAKRERIRAIERRPANDGQIVVRVPAVWVKRLRTADVDIAALVRGAMSDAITLLKADDAAS